MEPGVGVLPTKCVLSHVRQQAVKALLPERRPLASHDVDHRQMREARSMSVEAANQDFDGRKR
jgi:hypothetical protein